MPRPTENCWQSWWTNLKQPKKCFSTRSRGASHPLYKHWLGKVSCMLMIHWRVGSIIAVAWVAYQWKCLSPNQWKGLGSWLHDKESLVRLPVVWAGLKSSSHCCWCRHILFSTKVQLEQQPCYPVIWQSLDSSFHYLQQHEPWLSPCTT